MIPKLPYLWSQEEPKSSDDGTGDATEDCEATKWWESSKLNISAISIVIFPSILVSTVVSDAFSIATGIAVNVRAKHANLNLSRFSYTRCSLISYVP